MPLLNNAPWKPGESHTAHFHIQNTGNVRLGVTLDAAITGINDGVLWSTGGMAGAPVLIDPGYSVDLYATLSIPVFHDGTGRLRALLHVTPQVTGGQTQDTQYPDVDHITMLAPVAVVNGALTFIGWD